MRERIYLLPPPTCLNPDVQHRAWLPFSVPPSVKRCLSGTGIINPFPIAYAFRPRLRGRLTLLRLALSRNPWTFGERVSHPLCRYSCQHSHFRSLHRMPHGPASQSNPVSDQGFPEGKLKSEGFFHGTLRYHSFESSASAHGLSPDTSSPQDSLSRPVSCYAIFKGWLLLSQPPGCFGPPTCFPT